MNSYSPFKSLLFLPSGILWISTAMLGALAHAEGLPTLTPPSVSSPVFDYPIIDRALGEHLNPAEPALALEIATESEKKMRNDLILASANPTLQPKKCGCIKARFIISRNIPKALSQGVFIPGKSYDAWLRFSTNDSDPTHGHVTREASKVMIKLINIPGKKLNNDDDTSSQDFVLVNQRVNLIRDPRRYLELMNETNGVVLKKTTLPFTVGTNGTISSVDTIATTIVNPLQARYWSVVPYQLGLGESRLAVKYSVRGCNPEANRIRINLTPDYLHEAINGLLQQHPGCMQFLVQPRTAASMSVEDSSVEWNESEAPFYQVATIHFLAQDIEKPAQNELCEHLSFTPWHSLAEHRPLGITNRLRKAIYDHMKTINIGLNDTLSIKSPS